MIVHNIPISVQKYFFFSYLYKYVKIKMCLFHEKFKNCTQIGNIRKAIAHFRATAFPPLVCYEKFERIETSQFHFVLLNI